MGATPFILSLAPRAADLTARILGPVSRRHDRSGRPEPLSDGGAGPLADHLIVIGFGLNGRNVTRAAKAAGIPYVIVEMNPETVRSERRRGERIQYGDASQEAVLQHTGVTRARAMVIVISDPAATRRVTAVARQLNPALHIIARTRFLPEMKPLMELGADEVIPEEFETAVEIFARVLRTYLVPRDEIEQMVREVRSDGYEMFRGSSPRGVTVCGLEQYLPGMDIRTYRVAQGAPAANRSLAELALRKRWGVTVLAVGRGPRIIPNPEPDTVLEGADVALVMGSPEQVRGVQPLFHGASQEARP
jgi:CPA2 family monovalent cation:H+ antiporter-2